MGAKLKLSIVLCAAIIFSIKVEAQIKVLANGNVGVGLMTPNNTLDVMGNGAMFRTTTNNSPQSSPFIRCNSIFSQANTPDYTWASDMVSGLFHSAIGRVSITSVGWEIVRVADVYNSPYQFYVYGNTWCTSGWNSSDLRFKKNILPIQSAMSKVLKLNGVSYEFRREEFKTMNFNEGRNFGFIAQDVQKIFPELVKADENGYLGVNYTSLSPVLIEAMKEEYNEVEQLKITIEGLKKQIEELKTFVLQIKKEN